MKRLIKCEIEVQGPYDLGKGFQGYVALSPKGKGFIVEIASRGIVGDSIETVRKDIEEGDIEVMKEQVKQGIQDFKLATEVETSEFWRGFK